MSNLAVDPEGRRYELRPWDCPTCGPGPKRVIGVRGGRFHRYGLGIESTIVRCSSCTLLFADPFPVALDAQEMYGDPEKYFVMHGDFASKAARHCALIDEVRLRRGRADPSILDVGSGRGELLEAARMQGISTAIGLELSRAMIAAAAEHGLSVLESTAERFAATTDRRFDCVALAAVIEHVEDPDALVAATVQLVAPRGVVYIDVPRDPNIVTMIGRAVGFLRRSPGVLNLSPTFSPYHVYGFTPKSLRRVLEKHGLVVEDINVAAVPVVPHNGRLADRVVAGAAGATIRFGNAVGLAPNMTAWARRPA